MGWFVCIGCIVYWIHILFVLFVGLVCLICLLDLFILFVCKNCLFYLFVYFICSLDLFFGLSFICFVDQTWTGFLPDVADLRPMTEAPAVRRFITPSNVPGVLPEQRHFSVCVAGVPQCVPQILTRTCARLHGLRHGPAEGREENAERLTFSHHSIISVGFRIMI